MNHNLNLKISLLNDSVMEEIVTCQSAMDILVHAKEVRMISQHLFHIKIVSKIIFVLEGNCTGPKFEGGGGDGSLIPCYNGDSSCSCGAGKLFSALFLYKSSAVIKLN